MKMSHLFVQTLREYPQDAEVISHKLLVRAGYIKKLANGIYNYLPLMQRVLKKVENIIREEMDNAGGQELLMPFVQPEELWQESKRWDVYGKELLRLKDRHDKSMCLGPTHEEIITFIARETIRSYKQLPVNLYQIQTKFRDEIRPRFGLLRGREFIMKDAYSFDVDEKGLEKSYAVMTEAYNRIFERCGFETKMVQSDSGAIGGAISHEFMLVGCEAGEDEILYCENKGCDFGMNTELTGDKEVSTCPKCSSPLKRAKGIEVGNIFQLGTKYSTSMNATFTNEAGKEVPFVMGCYGIGVSRTAAAAVERYNDEFGIKWPIAIAPYHVIVVPVNVKDEQQVKVANEIYEKLLSLGIEAVIDDRDERAGVKFKDADLIGFPFRITVGKTIADGLVEFKERATSEMSTITPEEAISKLIP